MKVPRLAFAATVVSTAVFATLLADRRFGPFLRLPQVALTGAMQSTLGVNMVTERVAFAQRRHSDRLVSSTFVLSFVQVVGVVTTS